MKKFRSLILVLVACLCVLVGFNSNAEEWSQDYDYTFSDGLTYYVKTGSQVEVIDDILWEATIYNGESYVRVARYLKKSYGTVTVPSKVGNLSIGQYNTLGKANNVGFGDTDGVITINKFVVPNGIIKLDSSFMESDVNVKEFVFPSTLTEITGAAFLGNSHISSITLPDSVVTLGTSTFLDSSIKSIKLPKNLKELPQGTFEGCSKLTSVTLPDNLQSIGLCAFKDCTSLKTLIVPKSVTYLYEDKWGDGKYTIPSTITIYGYSGSAAESYAKKYGNTFVNIETGKKTVNGTAVAEVSNLKASSIKTSSVKLTWSKAKNATTYKVYRATGNSSSFKLITTTTKNTYTDTTIKTGTTYKYRVRGYSSKTKKYGDYSSKITVTAKLNTPTIAGLTTKSKKVTVKWNKVVNTTGYEVYMATSKKGKYTSIGTINKSKTVQYKTSKLKKGKTYYFKVRAYKTVSGIKQYSSYSAVKAIKIK